MYIDVLPLTSIANFVYVKNNFNENGMAFYSCIYAPIE